MDPTLLAAVQTLGDSIVQGVLLLGPEGELIVANRTTLQFFRAERVEEIRDLSARAERFRVVDANGQPVERRDLPAYRAIRGERFRDLEQVFIELESGEEHTLLFSGAPILDERGRIAYALVLFTDITERAQRGRTLQQELGAVEERFRLLLDQLTEHVMTRSLDGRVTHVNRSLAEFLGLPASALVGQAVTEVFGVPLVTEEITRALRLGHVVSRRLRMTDAAGAAHDLDWTWQIVPARRGSRKCSRSGAT